MRQRALGLVRAVAAVGAALLLLGPASAPAATGNGTSGSGAISGDGRLVAFASDASDLVAGDTNDAFDVFIRDRTRHTTERVSLATDGAQANGDTGVTALTPDGRFVVLNSDATNLVAGDTNGKADVYLRDRQAGTTERVSVGASQPNGDSVHGRVSADGRVVAFASNSTNLAAGSTTPVFRVYVRDRAAAATELIGTGWSPSLSADGRYVSFVSDDDRILVRDRTLGTTEEASVSTAGTPLPNTGTVASISADGRFVAMLMENQSSRSYSGVLYIRDRIKHTTDEIGDIGKGAYPRISADGRFVTYAHDGVFVYDLAAGTTRSATPGANSPSTSSAPLSADDRYVVFSSLASNLVSADENGKFDVFVRDLVAGTTELVSVARTPELVSVVRTAVVVAGVAGHPKRPAAGKTFAVTVPVTGANGPVGVRCAARVPGRVLRASAATFRSATARCAWRVPSRSHGAWLRGSIGVTTPGSNKVVRGFAARVR